MKYSTLTVKNLKYIRNMSRGNSLLRWANITIGGSDYVRDTLATVKITSICNFEKLDGIVAYEYEVYVHDMDGRCWDNALTFKVKVDQFKSTRAASNYVKEKVLEIFKNREAEILEEQEEEEQEEEIQRGCYIIALFYTNGELETMRLPLITDREEAQKFCDLYEQQQQVDKARLILSPNKGANNE